MVALKIADATAAACEAVDVQPLAFDGVSAGCKLHTSFGAKKHMAGAVSALQREQPALSTEQPLGSRMVDIQMPFEVESGRNQVAAVMAFGIE